MCFSCICLFPLHTVIFVFIFSSSWCRWLAATCVCVCGTPWTLLLTFVNVEMLFDSFNVEICSDCQ